MRCGVLWSSGQPSRHDEDLLLWIHGPDSHGVSERDGKAVASSTGRILAEPSLTTEVRAVEAGSVEKDHNQLPR